MVTSCAVCQLSAQVAIGYSSPTAPWQRLGLYSPPGPTGPSFLVDSLHHRNEPRGVSGYRGVHTGYAVHEPAIGPPETLHSLLHASKTSPHPYPSPFNAQFIVPSRPSGTNHVLSHFPGQVPSQPCPQTSSHNDPARLVNNIPLPQSVLHALLNSPYFRGPVTSPGYYSSSKPPPSPTFNIGYQPFEGSHFPFANKPYPTQ